MIVETRKTAAGTEYWDNEAKKVLFVPKGKKPSFEVTKDPKSMVGGYIDESNTPVVTDLNELTVPQLKEYAANSGIEIPSDIKRKEDIIKLLSDTE